MLNIPEGATITVTNESSRSFICGGEMIMPHIPTEVNEHMARVIDGSPYGSYFRFEYSTNSVEPPADTRTNNPA